MEFSFEVLSFFGLPGSCRCQHSVGLSFCLALVKQQYARAKSFEEDVNKEERLSTVCAGTRSAPNEQQIHRYTCLVMQNYIQVVDGDMNVYMAMSQGAPTQNQAH
ncbi:hypothetical protein BDW22DRAFT_527599 [Trametopsis cervina]|nr:hypothetical protein BDW22DRAFT_527599 [Trametopsis cervina]